MCGATFRALPTEALIVNDIVGPLHGAGGRAVSAAKAEDGWWSGLVLSRGLSGDFSLRLGTGRRTLALLEPRLCLVKSGHGYVREGLVY